MTAELTAEKRARRDDAVCVLQDLPLLWIDARCAGATMKRRPDPHVDEASAEPAAIVDRVETELFGEAGRYRQALWACIAICVMPPVLAMFAWSAMYWLPVRIMWFPFERGFYGLPWLSLYEWVAYLLLAVFFIFGFALIAESSASTRRLSADYRRLAEATPEGRAAIVESVRAARADRTELVLRNSKPFSAYRDLLDETADDRSTEPPAERPAAPWPVRSALVLVLGVLAIDLLGGGAVRSLAHSHLGQTQWSLALAATFGMLYAIEIGIVAVVARSRGTTLAKTVALHVPAKPWAWVSTAVATGLGLRIVAAVYSAIMLALGLRVQGWDVDPTRFFPSTVIGSVVLVLIVAVGAPFAEEIVFRGVVLPSTSEKWGVAWGTVITSAVFASLHLSIFAFIPIFIVAWALARLRVRSGSLWPSVVCHATFNAVGVLIVLLVRGSGAV